MRGYVGSWLLLWILLFILVATHRNSSDAIPSNSMDGQFFCAPPVGGDAKGSYESKYGEKPKTPPPPKKKAS